MPIASDRKQKKAREARLLACERKPHLAEAIRHNSEQDEKRRKLKATIQNLTNGGMLIPKPGVMADGIQELREAGNAALQKLPIDHREMLRAQAQRRGR